MKTNKVVNKEKTKIVSNKKIYFLLFIIFLIGILIGAMYVNNLGDEHKSLLVSDINSFLTLNMQNKIIPNFNFFLNILISNIKYIILILIFGLSYKMIPLMLALVFFKGFSYGFTTLFLINSYGNYGIKVMLSSYFASDILQILLIFLATCMAIKYAMERKERAGKVASSDIIKLTFEYLVIMFGIILLCLIFSVLENYLTPVLLSFVKIS